MIGVDLDIFGPLFGDIFVPEDGFDGAGRLAGSAIDAFIGVDIEHFSGLVFGFILARVDAIDGADIDAGGILGADAGFSDDVNGHYGDLLSQF